MDRFSQLVCFLCGKFESGGWREEGGRSGKHVSWQPRVPHASTSHKFETGTSANFMLVTGAGMK